MPRQLTANMQTTIAQKQGTEPINIVAIKWNGSTELYYASRDVTIDSTRNVRGAILSIGEIDALTTVSGQSANVSLSLTLSDLDGVIKGFFDTIDINKKPARVLQYFEGLAFSDCVELFRGEINSPIVWNESERSISLSILSHVESYQVGFALEEGQFSCVAPQHVGTAWPLAFGEVLHVPAVKATEVVTGTTQSFMGIPDYTLPYKYWHLVERLNVLKDGYRYYSEMVNMLRGIARSPAAINTDYILVITREDFWKQNLEDLSIWIADNDKYLNIVEKFLLEGLGEERLGRNEIMNDPTLWGHVELIFNAFMPATPEGLPNRAYYEANGSAMWKGNYLFDRLIIMGVVNGADLAEEIEKTIKVTWYKDDKPPRINNPAKQRSKPRTGLKAPFDYTYTTYETLIQDYCFTLSYMTFALNMIKTVQEFLLRTQKTKDIIEIEADNAVYADTNIRDINTKIRKTLVEMVKTEQLIAKLKTTIFDQSFLQTSQVSIIGGECFPQNQVIHIQINGLVFEGVMNGYIFTIANVVPRYSGIVTAPKEDTQIDTFYVPDASINLKGQYCMTTVKIKQSDPEWVLKQYGYDVNPYQIRIFKVIDQVGRRCTIELKEVAPAIRVRPQVKPNVIVGGVPQNRNDQPFHLNDLPSDVKAALGYAKEFTDNEIVHILQNAILKYDAAKLKELEDVVEKLTDASKKIAFDDQDAAMRETLAKSISQYNKFLKRVRFTGEAVTKIGETISQKEYDILLKMCNLKLRQQNSVNYDDQEVPSNRLYVITGDEIKFIQATSATPLPSWLQFQNELQNLVDGGDVISLPNGGKVLAEFLPDSTLWYAEPGTDARLLDDQTVKYVANILPSTIYGVFGKRAINGFERLVPIPLSYYVLNGADSFYAPMLCTTITLRQPLSDYAGEDWSEEVYVSMESSVGPNTVDIISWILVNHTNITPDATSFATVQAQLTNYPSSFALFDKRDALQLIQDIAYQARCAVWVKAGVMYIRYLAAEPSSDDELVEDEMIYTSISIEGTPTESQATKYVATWRPNYAVDKEYKIVLRYNTAAYGEITETQDFYIYNIESLVYKAATFWLIRKANSWKLLKFKTPLTKLNIETFDVLDIDIPYVAPQPVKGIVQKAVYNSQDNTIDIEVWLPIRMGESTPYDFAWPASVGATVMYPSAGEINAGYAGSYHGDVPVNSPYRFNSNASLVEALSLRPKDYGEIYTSDAAFSLPNSPLVGISQYAMPAIVKDAIKVPNVPLMAQPGGFFRLKPNDPLINGAFDIIDVLKQIASGAPPATENLKEGVIGGASDPTLRSNTGDTENKSAMSMIPGADSDTAFSMACTISAINDEEMGEYTVKDEKGREFTAFRFGDRRDENGDRVTTKYMVGDSITATWSSIAGRYYIMPTPAPPPSPPNGSGSDSGSNAPSNPSGCTGQVYSIVRYHEYVDLDGVMFQVSALETLEYNEYGCLVLTRGEEITEQIGCAPCDPADFPPPAYVTCCGENSFTYPSKIAASITGASGTLSTVWTTLTRKIVALSTESLPDGTYTEWPVSDVDGRFFDVTVSVVGCIDMDPDPDVVRVTAQVSWSAGVTGTIAYSALAAGWALIDVGSPADGIYKDFACDGTFDLTSDLTLCTVTFTGMSDSDHDGAFTIVLELPLA